VLLVDTSSRYPVAPLLLDQLAVKLVAVMLVAAFAVGEAGADAPAGSVLFVV
jgi:hypothetical protein